MFLMLPDKAFIRPRLCVTASPLSLGQILILPPQFLHDAPAIGGLGEVHKLSKSERPKPNTERKKT